ncbi:MAG: hypothetical protein Ta2B_30390 [Termitinemataceae bacterium]|nr:MAG: hypothetical protein Ta2B_30390 [Termitinemataceae bacterium]
MQETTVKKMINWFVGVFRRKLDPTDVFVPGGIPQYTYFDRSGLGLDKKVIDALKENKIVIVTGQTKSGKSVLVKKTIGEPRVIIEGGAITHETDFWDHLILQLNAFTSVTYTATKAETHIKGKSQSFNFFKIDWGTHKEFQRSLSSRLSVGRDVSKKVAAINVLRDIKIPLIIDDFHYIGRDIQLDIVRSLKAPVANGLPVVLIAIPHRKFDPVRVEREMTGRTEILEIPSWNESELGAISEKGFPLLNMLVEPVPKLSYQRIKC